MNVKMDELFERISELSRLLRKREEAEEDRACGRKLLWILAAVGAVVAIAGIAYAVYRYLTPDYLEDFDDDFDDDDFIGDDDDIEEDDMCCCKGSSEGSCENQPRQSVDIKISED